MSAANGAGELHLVLEAHGHLFAISTAVIERMLLAEEAQPRPVEGGRIIEIDGHAWPCANLGTIVGQTVLRNAYVLMHVPHPSGSVRVALETGPCLVVRPLTRLGGLPPGIFRDRVGAFAGTFDAAVIARARQRVTSPVGLVIDVAKLFNDGEVASLRGRILAHIGAAGGRA